MQQCYSGWTCTGSYRHSTWGVTHSSAKPVLLVRCVYVVLLTGTSLLLLHICTPALSACKHPKTNHINTHSKAWIRTLGWPCAVLQTINGAIKKWAIKHAVIEFIASKGTSGKNMVCVFNLQRKGKKTFMYQFKSQNPNRITYHQPFIAICPSVRSSLGWHCVFVSRLSRCHACAHVYVFVCV